MHLQGVFAQFQCNGFANDSHMKNKRSLYAATVEVCCTWHTCMHAELTLCVPWHDKSSYSHSLTSIFHCFRFTCTIVMADELAAKKAKELFRSSKTQSFWGALFGKHTEIQFMTNPYRYPQLFNPPKDDDRALATTSTALRSEAHHTSLVANPSSLVA